MVLNKKEVKEFLNNLKISENLQIKLIDASVDDASGIFVSIVYAEDEEPAWEFMISFIQGRMGSYLVTPRIDFKFMIKYGLQITEEIERLIEYIVITLFKNHPKNVWYQ